MAIFTKNEIDTSVLPATNVGWPGQTLRNDITFIHELGRDLSGGIISKALIVPPSDEPTIVRAISQVVTHAARAMNSPEYLSIIRRRKCAAIGELVSLLAKKAHRDDFVAFTFKVFDATRALLGQLTVVPSEGNTRQILRHLRDSFLDGGHERYRDPKARDLVRSILTRLSEAEDVTPEDFDQVWDELFDAGLSARIPAVFIMEEGNDGADG